MTSDPLAAPEPASAAAVLETGIMGSAMDTDRSDWRDRAACLRADPDLFFPISTAGPAARQVDEAKRICRTCSERRNYASMSLDAGQLGSRPEAGSAGSGSGLAAGHDARPAGRRQPPVPS